MVPGHPDGVHCGRSASEAPPSQEDLPAQRWQLRGKLSRQSDVARGSISGIRGVGSNDRDTTTGNRRPRMLNAPFYEDCFVKATSSRRRALVIQPSHASWSKVGHFQRSESMLEQPSIRAGRSSPAPHAACAPSALAVPSCRRAPSLETVPMRRPGSATGALTSVHDGDVVSR
jgi:hypothetical protein